MKTLTCAQFGGPCDFSATTASEKEMSDIMWKHVKDAHPEKSETTQIIVKEATQEQKDQRDAYFHKVWETTNEDK